MNEWRSLPYWLGQMTVRIGYIAAIVFVVVMSAIASARVGHLIYGCR
jgi:hypothetical protein